jgi:hypothetical protein
MNRFRTKRKNKEAAEGLGRGSTDSDAPSVPATKPSKTFRLGKKQQPQPEPKLELDLANALPPSDDFRTSLLMSGLSARFSMLREQDDPNSKIGKASDDSVIFSSRRQSRLNDFGFPSHGLSDIAEVSSINGSIRPPFAATRADSYKTTGSTGTDDDSLHSGSIMSRPKPGEGNVLFGGRQKIYKIPVDSSGTIRSFSDGSTPGMGGRALYENDVSLSAFQRLRQREKEQQEVEREEAEQNARSGSPPLSNYNRNWETSSTTSSGGPSITRTSTAATSVTSQRTPSLSGSHTPVTAAAASSTNPSVERSTTKTRRLYETGLDQHLHEQQFSAMNRIDTLTKQRTMGAQTPPPGLTSPTSLPHPVDRWDRNQITAKASMPNLRAASPPPTAATKSTFGMPPLSPPMSDNGDYAVLTVQPNDRGKATALGAFSKPAQPYDENKYSQRQLQMQQGRETPPLRKPSPAGTFVSRQQQQLERNIADSNTMSVSAKSDSNSSAPRQVLPRDRIQETTPEPEPTVAEEQAIKSGTFLASPDSDSSGSGEPVSQSRGNMHPRDLASMYRRDQNTPLQRPPESQHPANRQRPFEPQQSPLDRSTRSSPQKSKLQSNPEALLKPTVNILAVPTEPSTLTATTDSRRLSGMVRQHLRSDSNTSSVYGAPSSAGLVSRFPTDCIETLPQNEYATRNEPWERDDWDQRSSSENKSSLDISVNGTRADGVVPPPLSVRSPNVEGAGIQSRKSSWEKELEAHHRRDGSSETQKERLDFKLDLAARRRRVQENLKSFVETESRSGSPLPGAERPKDVLAKTHALGLLKPKTSRTSLAVKSKESKPAKVFGTGFPIRSNSPSSGKASFDEIRRKQEEEGMERVDTKGSGFSPPNKAFRQACRDAQRDRERQLAQRVQQRLGAETDGLEGSNRPVPEQRGQSRDRAPPNIRTRQRSPSREGRPHQVPSTPRDGSSQQSQVSVGTIPSVSRPASRASRDRSNSDTSVDSKSRNGRYRDDLANAMAERASSSRSRSNSRSNPNGHSESQMLQSIQTGAGVDTGILPRPSPTTPFSNYSSSQPSAPGSGTNNPAAQGSQSQQRLPTTRKRSVNKSDISEPKFVSATSRMTTVNLPPGASLQNGVEAPPIPPVNPRRKVRPMFGFGKREDSNDYPLSSATHSTEEMSTFSDDGEPRPSVRQMLRKAASEGGNLNARARQAALSTPSPAMPEIAPNTGGSSPHHIEGGMF